MPPGRHKTERIKIAEIYRGIGGETVHGLATTLPLTVMVTSAAVSSHLRAPILPPINTHVCAFHEHLQLLIFKSEGSRGIDIPAVTGTCVAISRA